MLIVVAEPTHLFLVSGRYGASTFLNSFRKRDFKSWVASLYLPLPPLHTHTQTHTDVDAGRRESNKPGNQVVSRTRPALWWRLPSRAWPALQSELSVVTTV